MVNGALPRRRRSPEINLWLRNPSPGCRRSLRHRAATWPQNARTRSRRHRLLWCPVDLLRRCHPLKCLRCPMAGRIRGWDCWVRARSRQKVDYFEIKIILTKLKGAFLVRLCYASNLTLALSRELRLSRSDHEVTARKRRANAHGEAWSYSSADL